MISAKVEDSDAPEERSARKDVERTCRYGHGPLRRQLGAWSLRGFTHPRYPTKLEDAGLKGEDLEYTVLIHRCRVCGYLELSDADF